MISRALRKQIDDYLRADLLRSRTKIVDLKHELRDEIDRYEAVEALLRKLTPVRRRQP